MKMLQVYFNISFILASIILTWVVLFYRDYALNALVIMGLYIIPALDNLWFRKKQDPYPTWHKILDYLVVFITLIGAVIIVVTIYIFKC